MIRIDGLAVRCPFRCVDVPAAVGAAFEGFDGTLVGLKVPVHVYCFLLPAFGICGEAAAALGAGGTKSFVKTRNDVWSGTADC